MGVHSSEWKRQALLTSDIPLWYHLKKGNVMTEIWKDIIGFEGKMKISNYGKVFNIKTNRILKGNIHKSNTTTYIRINMPDNSRKLLHRIVAEAFIINTENKPFINHIDNDGMNNSVLNLEWCTQTENMQHAYKQGRLDERLLKSRTKAYEITREKFRKNAEDKIGMIINNWKIVGLSDKKYSCGHKAVFVECTLCKTVKERALSHILSGESKMCNTCKYKFKK